MTYIPVNFDDAVEAKPAAAGRYNLQITQCEIVKTGEKSKRPGSPQYKVSIGFMDEENTPNITQFISLPHEEDEKKSSDYKVLLLKRFLELFKVPYDRNGIDTEKLAMEMVGCSAFAEVQLSDPDDNGNVYNRLVVPRLSNEAQQQGRQAPPTASRRRG